MFFGKKKEPLIDRLKWDTPSNDILVHRWPVDNLSWGTQVIVNTSQEALFYKDGDFLDLLGPGRHTLKTANIPLLEKIVNIPFGSESPFAAEVFYVNKAANLAVKWGTRSPIMIEDAQYGVMLPIRAFGQFGIRIKDSLHFVKELVGTTPGFDTAQITEYFRGMLLTRCKDRIAEVLVKENIPVLKVSAYLDEISADLQESVKDEFAKFGVEIVNFYLTSINVPDDDPSVVRLKELMTERAEFNIMGDDRYRMKRSFDTLETAAGNEGGGAGQLMGAGIGAGVGMGMGGMMGSMVGNTMNTNTPQAAQPQAHSKSCPSCNTAVSETAKFCPSCGEGLAAPTIDCGSCSAAIPADAKFCPECGTKNGPASCSSCNAELAPGAKFCPECGTKQ